MKYVFFDIDGVLINNYKMGNSYARTAIHCGTIYTDPVTMNGSEKPFLNIER